MARLKSVGSNSSAGGGEEDDNDDDDDEDEDGYDDNDVVEVENEQPAAQGADAKPTTTKKTNECVSKKTEDNHVDNSRSHPLATDEINRSSSPNSAKIAGVSEQTTKMTTKPNTEVVVVDAEPPPTTLIGGDRL